MIDGLGEGAVNDAEFLGYFCGVWEEFTDPNTLVVVVVFLKIILRGAERQPFLSGRHSSDSLTIADVFGEVLTKHLLHLGFVVPHVLLAGTTAHKEVDDPLGFGRMVKSVGGGGRLGKSFRAEELGHRGCSQSKGTPAKELASGEVEFVVAKWIHRKIKVGNLKYGEGNVAGEHSGDHLSPGGELGGGQSVINGGLAGSEKGLGIGRSGLVTLCQVLK